MPLTITPSPVQPLQPMPPEPSPASPVVQTLDKDDDEDIAEDQPMPAQLLLPARRPRAPSIADPGAAVETPADAVPAVTPGVATPAEAPVQVVPAAPAIDASSEGAVAPASKKARQYDLQPQQSVQPMPHLQPPLPTSSSSPAALQEPTTTSSPTEPETKKHKQQHAEDDEDLVMDSLPSIAADGSSCATSYLNINQLLQRILKPAGHEAGLTVKCPKLRLYNTLTQLLIRHVKLDNRKLLFLNHLHFCHLIRRREVLL